MNENGRKRREWIKSAAIVFLTILLILTFFSNTIMNYSLPEVAAQYIQSGTITAKIRGYGVIESGDPYSVKINEARVVETVEVHVGDVVEKGDVLCTLSSQDTSALEDAKEALKIAQTALDEKLLSGELDTDIMNTAGQTDSVKNYKAIITRIQNEIEAAESEVEKAKADVKACEDWDAALALQIQIENANTLDTKAEQKAVDDAKAALDAANLVLTNAKKLVTDLQAQIDAATAANSGSVQAPAPETTEAPEATSEPASTEEPTTTAAPTEASIATAEVSTTSSVDVEALKIQLADAKAKEADEQKACDYAQAAYNKAVEALEKKQQSYDKDSVIANLQKQQVQNQVALRDANKVLAAKEAALQEKLDEKTDAIKNINDQVLLGNLSDAVEEARAEVKRLEETISGSEVLAPISGTIMSVNVKSGIETPDATSEGIILFTMQPEGEGYTMSISVTNDQAKRLSVGDIAEPVNAWRYDDIMIVLDSIRPDPSNPAQNKLLKFNVSGADVVANQSMNISVGQKSATFDMIVPNSAIREDNNGKFILIVESKQSPIGTRYTASRVDVEVIASDETKSAISGALQGWEFVITTTTKPVEAGQQVRLPE